MLRHTRLLLLLLAAAPSEAAFSQTCPGIDELYPLTNANVSMSHAGTRIVAAPYLWDEQSGPVLLANVIGIPLFRGGGNSNLPGPQLSGDGEVIVGLIASVTSSTTDYAVMRWTSSSGAQFVGTGFGGIPAPNGIDQDGDTFVGPIGNPEDDAVEGVWTPSGVTTIGVQGQDIVVPTAVSSDGLTVVGYTHPVGTSIGEARPFRWSAALGLQQLGALVPGGTGASKALGVNADGTVVVGQDSTSGQSRPFIWTEGGGIEPLEVPAGAGLFASAEGISADGEAAVGYYNDAMGTYRPLKWTRSGDAYELPEVPSYSPPSDSRALQTSGDGTFVAGVIDNGPVYRVRTTQLGSTYCEFANPNSTGCYSRLEVRGSAVVSDNNVTLSARRLPVDVFGFFLISGDTGNTPLTNSNGILCLGGFIGRFVETGQIKNSGLDGFFELGIDLGSVPLQFGTGAIQAGETWNFQAWHRDIDAMGNATSNLTDAVAVTFR